MKVIVDAPAFKKAIKSIVSAFKDSDLGREAIADDSAVLWLEAVPESLKGAIAHKGFEVKTSLAGTCEEAGKIPIKLGVLEKLACGDKTVELAGTDRELTFRAGRLRASVKAVQGAKQSNYDEIPLTRTFKQDSLARAVKASSFESVPEGSPFLRLVSSAHGVYCWTHNSYNAAVACATEDPHDTFDCNINAKIAEAALAASDEVQLGTNGRAWRISNGIVDITHPIHRVEIQDVPGILAGLTLDSVPQCTILVKELEDALSAVAVLSKGSDRVKTSACLSLLNAKERLTVSGETAAGYTSYRCQAVEISNVDVEKSVTVNASVFLSFVERITDKSFTLYMMDDRVLLKTTDATFVLALVQEEE